MNPAEIVSQRRAMLEALRPIKAEARERATELYNRKQELKGEAKERATVRELVDNHPFDLFPTPAPLARRMAEMAIPAPLDFTGRILEPSAGTGNIAEAIRARMIAGYCLECIELNYQAAQYLTGKAFVVINTNFLAYETRADAIIMNPPFSNAQDIDHVSHAWDCLNPGGRIVAIMSAGTMYRQDKKTRAFRETILQHATHQEELPAGTFAQSGTNVSTILLVIEKG